MSASSSRNINTLSSELEKVNEELKRLEGALEAEGKKLRQSDTVIPLLIDECDPSQQQYKNLLIEKIRLTSKKEMIEKLISTEDLMSYANEAASSTLDSYASELENESNKILQLSWSTYDNVQEVAIKTNEIKLEAYYQYQSSLLRMYEAAILTRVDKIAEIDLDLKKQLEDYRTRMHEKMAGVLKKLSAEQLAWIVSVQQSRSSKKYCITVKKDGKDYSIDPDLRTINLPEFEKEKILVNKLFYITRLCQVFDNPYYIYEEQLQRFRTLLEENGAIAQITLGLSRSEKKEVTKGSELVDDVLEKLQRLEWLVKLANTNNEAAKEPLLDAYISTICKEFILRELFPKFEKMVKEVDPSKIECLVEKDFEKSDRNPSHLRDLTVDLNTKKGNYTIFLYQFIHPVYQQKVKELFSEKNKYLLEKFTVLLLLALSIDAKNSMTASEYLILKNYNTVPSQQIKSPMFRSAIKDHNLGFLPQVKTTKSDLLLKRFDEFVGDFERLQAKTAVRPSAGGGK